MNTGARVGAAGLAVAEDARREQII